MAPSAHEEMTPPSTGASEKVKIGNEATPRYLEVNETGHVQELERNFSLLSVCSVGIVTGNTWAAFGGSIAVAIYNGGPPGVLYEFIAVSVFYWLVAASLAELASAMPSSAGVYHWASITPGPKYGRVCGWFAGWWNTFAWYACPVLICASASMASISAQIAMAMYVLYHPGFVPERWQIFIAHLIVTWICCSIVLFANRALPMVNNIGLFFILAGVFITIVICAVLPHTSGSGYASSSFVWADWSNQTGYTSNGFVFLAGLLNGAYAVGTPDCVSHLAEEIPNPRRNVPLAIAAQMVIGFFTAFFYMIALFYATTNLDDVLSSTFFPLATIYSQATGGSVPATFGLLFIIFVPIFCTCIGTFITAGRCLWTLARDDAVPLSGFFGKISPRFKNPFNATLICGCFSTCLGAIYVGSTQAFGAFVGSFVVLSTLSYLAAILPFIFTKRFSRAGATPGPFINNMRPGPYKMGNKVGYAVNIISCLYIIVFVVIFCFPYSMPVTAANMNYACLIAGAISIFAAIWWFVKGGKYTGPQALVHEDAQLEDSAGSGTDKSAYR
ncbi:Choline transport protein [Lachnellula suecica]|uniref:Choline transport protein n=1 Tax=Lachnellula suecica TaxID=602035 RepID=A0A8T9CBF2_9HELO|nr:Choline transport protein [Lachnellula suecica]